MVWLLIVTGCSQYLETQRALDEEEVLAAMGEHWEEAEAMREAVVVGDLDEVHTLAASFEARLPVPGVPKDLLPIEAQLRQAVGKAKGATNLADAGAAVGEMAAACGGCHQRAKVKPELPSRVKPMTSENPTLEMVWHHVAIANLWASVVRYDKEAFGEASDQLAKAKFDLDSSTATGDALQGLEDRVQQLSARGREASDVGERGAILGEMLGTCAACHAAAGVEF